MEAHLLDKDLASAEKGKDAIRQSLEKQIAKGRMDQKKADAILKKIHATSDFSDLKDCDLVIEAVFENRDIKAEVTKETEKHISEKAFLASNTSTLPITGLAEASLRPPRFIGIHFFSPVERMQLVEIIRGKKSSDEALAAAMDYVRAIGKIPIVVNDSRGFYTSRTFGTYVREGMAMLSEGIPAALIENAGRMTGMPMPPLWRFRTRWELIWLTNFKNKRARIWVRNTVRDRAIRLSPLWWRSMGAMAERMGRAFMIMAKRSASGRVCRLMPKRMKSMMLRS